MVFPSGILPTIEETERTDPTAWLNHKGSDGVKAPDSKQDTLFDTIYITFWKSQNYRKRKQIYQAVGIRRFIYEGPA